MSFFLFLTLGFLVGLFMYTYKKPEKNTLLQYSIVGILGSFLSNWATTAFKLSSLPWFLHFSLALVFAFAAIKAFDIREKKRHS
jgi:uncharacterized membrane protein YeaQ/YmgE (transglycosylase-associated protein family)